MRYVDRVIIEQVLPGIRQMVEKYQGTGIGCWCLKEVDPEGHFSLEYLEENWAPTPYYYQHVSGFARFLRASKVLSFSNTSTDQIPKDAKLQMNSSRSACSDRQGTLVFCLILPDGSLEWTITQRFRRNGKQIVWDEPEKSDGGFQSFLPAWDSPGNAN
jgi:hypothetical protein